MDYWIKRLITLLAFVLLAAFVWLIVVGQKNIGYAGLGMMMGGLCGILLLLWLYNRKHR